MPSGPGQGQPSAWAPIGYSSVIKPDTFSGAGACSELSLSFSYSLVLGQRWVRAFHRGRCCCCCWASPCFWAPCKVSPSRASGGTLGTGSRGADPRGCCGLRGIRTYLHRRGDHSLPPPHSLPRLSLLSFASSTSGPTLLLLPFFFPVLSSFY